MALKPKLLAYLSSFILPVDINLINTLGSYWLISLQNAITVISRIQPRMQWENVRNVFINLCSCRKLEGFYARTRISWLGKLLEINIKFAVELPSNEREMLSEVLKEKLRWRNYLWLRYKKDQMTECSTIKVWTKIFKMHKKMYVYFQHFSQLSKVSKNHSSRAVFSQVSCHAPSTMHAHLHCLAKNGGS